MVVVVLGAQASIVVNNNIVGIGKLCLCRNSFLDGVDEGLKE